MRFSSLTFWIAPSSSVPLSLSLLSRSCSDGGRTKTTFSGGSRPEPSPSRADLRLLTPWTSMSRRQTLPAFFLKKKEIIGWEDYRFLFYYPTKYETFK